MESSRNVWTSDFAKDLFGSLFWTDVLWWPDLLTRLKGLVATVGFT
jgi:hypothetical protein